MINYSGAHILRLSIHHVGSKAEDEGVRLSDESISRPADLDEILLHYFFAHFKRPEFYAFTFSSDQVELNPLFNYATKIFENPAELHENSTYIAKHLYQVSDHPNINSGDILVAHVKELIVGDEMVEGIVICKSESKDDFIKLVEQNNNYVLDSDRGVNINQIDKACIILNTEKESGYKLCVIDHLNKGREAVYWKSSFLNVQPRSDDYHATLNYIQMTKSFVKERLKPLYDVDKTDEAAIMNRSKEFFKNQEEFNHEEYELNILRNEDQRQDFRDYVQDFQEEKSVELPTTFSISEEAFKKKARVFKSVLKLDKNFHIYIHGKKDMIEKGVDENGRKFYKIFYETEN